ncbi:MAG: AsmA family protein, partial [Syntrophaceae bacterium]|nr:AsmA family protein [Syntrophaceae bacterium]
MSRYRKLFLRVVLGVVFLIMLLVGFGLLLPYLINLEPLREKILNAASQRLNGNAKYERLDLSYFPQPHVKIHQIRFLFPEKADGVVKSVEVYPEWIALFKGKFRVRTIHVQSPNVNVRLSKKIDQIEEKTEANLLEKIKEMLADTSVIVPKMKVTIEDGKLNLYTESKPLFS